MTHRSSTLWPLAGLRWFVAHPRLWWKPLIAHGIAVVMMLILGVSMSYWLWPAREIGPEALAWWWQALRISGAIGAGIVTAFSAWIVMVPLVLALVLDSLAAAVFRERGLPDIPVSAPQSLATGLVVLMRTFPLRLGWLLVMGAALFTGPLAPFIVTYAIARVAVVDAYDIGLGVRGVSSADRLAYYAAQRSSFRHAALTAGALQMGLACTFVGWLLWLPALVCGAALHIADAATPTPEEPAGSGGRSPL